MTMPIVAALAVLALAGAAPAHADRDTDFATQLHGFGIYGQRDFNAWLIKITCKRLSTGVDADARRSAEFVSRNLARGTSTEQVWQFMGAGIPMYCPEHTAALTALTGDHR
ncbi:hypothetical protein BST17_14225 [Mycolicibacterium bacteremicum]|uniref:DUF732 domain-containing protein n=1 Tax=Mycolicibacterium bacteremicum TaxID=564198 RepID=A0A1W9YWJ4_MYCBA|nr:hypothetical protein BST17_14225 [Mycolicibacterium bacteremicum]